MTAAKKNFWNVTCIILILSAISCDFGLSDKSVPETKNAIEDAFSTGKWKITAFKKNGIGLEQHYQYYLFTFRANNQVCVKEGNHKYLGHWEIESSENEDDAPKTDVDFELIFEENEKLSELEACWQIVERSKSKLVLEKVSISGKGIDSIVFCKERFRNLK